MGKSECCYFEEPNLSPVPRLTRFVTIMINGYDLLRYLCNQALSRLLCTDFLALHLVGSKLNLIESPVVSISQEKKLLGGLIKLLSEPKLDFTFSTWIRQSRVKLMAVC